MVYGQIYVHAVWTNDIACNVLNMQNGIVLPLNIHVVLVEVKFIDYQNK